MVYSAQINDIIHTRQPATDESVLFAFLTFDMSQLLDKMYSQNQPSPRGENEVLTRKFPEEWERERDLVSTTEP